MGSGGLDGGWLSPQFRSWNLDEQLASVRCPVLAIHGDLDEYGSVVEDVLRLSAAFLERTTRGGHE